MKESYFIGVSEVQEIVGCSKSRAYQFIQQMNKELEAKGLLTFPGRVPRRYVFERFGITEVQDDAKGNNPAGGNSGGATTGNRKHGAVKVAGLERLDYDKRHCRVQRDGQEPLR